MLLLVATASSQIINIPDVNFKAKLLAANSTTNLFAGSYSAMGYYPWIKIDTNNDGEIEVSEAQSVYSLHIYPSFSNNSDILSNLTGIEYFTNLENLSCRNNNLTTINLTNLTNLKTLSCQNNQIYDLNINGLINLETLTCQYNQISILDFTNLPNIFFVNCIGNFISDLDFHTNPIFKHLSCGENPNLTNINLKNGVIQSTSPFIFNSDCFDDCPNLTNICADDDEIQLLQNYLSICNSNSNNINISSNCALANDNFILNNVKIYPNPFKTIFEISIPLHKAENIIVKVYDILGKNIETVDLSGQELQKLELGKNYSSGVYNVLVQLGTNYQTLRLIKE